MKACDGAKPTLRLQTWASSFRDGKATSLIGCTAHQPMIHRLNWCFFCRNQVARLEPDAMRLARAGRSPGNARLCQLFGRLVPVSNLPRRNQQKHAKGLGRTMKALRDARFYVHFCPWDQYECIASVWQGPDIELLVFSVRVKSGEQSSFS